MLNSSRGMGFGSIGYIPLTEIEAFCRIMPVADVPRFVEIMRHLDGLYVEYQNERLSKKP